MNEQRVMQAREAIARGEYSETSDAMGIAARRMIRKAVASKRLPPPSQANFNRDFED